MGAKDKVAAVIIGASLFFALIVVLRLAMWISSPDPSIEEWTNIFEFAVVPIWVGFPPILIVALFAVAVWAGVEDWL